jgi:hypothetical protein
MLATTQRAVATQSAATQTDAPYDLQAMLLEKGVKAPTDRVKKPGSTKTLSSWLGVFTLAVGAGALACKLYQAGTAPTCKR